MQKSNYRSEIWWPSAESITPAPLAHCQWVDGDVRLSGLENNSNQDASRGIAVAVARLRLESPINNAAWGRNEEHQIRSRSIRGEEIGTLMRSLVAGSPRITLTPTMAVDDDGRVVIKLKIVSDVAEAEVGQEYQVFWAKVVRHAARALAKDLSRGIEVQLSGVGLDPESEVEEHVGPDNDGCDGLADEDHTAASLRRLAGVAGMSRLLSHHVES